MCAIALLVGVLAPSPAIAVTARAEVVGGSSCPSAVPTYVVTRPNGPSSATVTRYVDWDPKTTVNLFSSQQSATFDQVVGVFSGGGKRIFKTGPKGGLGLETSLRSYQDKSETGGSVLSLEYTYEERQGQNWQAYRHIWTDADGRVVTIDEAGNLHVYVTQFPDGKPASARMSRLAQLPADNPALMALRESSSLWAAGDKIYGLLDGTIRSWDYSAALNRVTLGPVDGGTVVLDGLTDAATAWSPAPGIFYTKSAHGAVKKYAGTPVALVHDDVTGGLTGQVFAGAAPCVSGAGDEKPYFGEPAVDDSSVPPVPPVPTPSAPPAGPEKVSGRFLLPDGSPAAGMEVVVEASDARPENDDAVNLPDVGTTTTDADGAWSLTIPETLPSAVQTAVDDNGGALNVSATTTGRTASGVLLVGVDNLTAAPVDPATGTRSRFGATAAESEPDHTVKLLPALADPETVVPDPTPQQQKTTYAASANAQSVDVSGRATPRWQSDRAPAPANHNPYLVEGSDIASERVSPAPRADTCWWDMQVVSRQISYTVVGESHAYWDAAGNVEYKSALSNTLDVGYSASGELWSISGSVSIGRAASGVAGFSWRGPFWAKQWKVPIEYEKIKRTRRCGGIPMKSYYEIRPSKYKVPAGQPVGTYGKDARHLDGPVAYRSSNPRYRSFLQPYGTWAVEDGKSVKWAAAASAFGVSIGGSTNYDQTHKQNIRAGGKTARKHLIWGYSAPPGAQMGIIYSN
ncbi:hypothetical protein [Streptomyces sp. NPDC047097]|uniref:hypothetical protein n=1 Tax=Streptomyces sp. NPDC047097 TaxID=3155260 RepID=UPI0033C88F70